MFSTGQLIFAIAFLIVFVIIIFYSYRGDKKLHRKHYKGNFWVLVIFVFFILLLVGVKMIFKS